MEVGATNGLLTFEIVCSEYVHAELLRHKRLSFNWMSHRAAGVKRFAEIGHDVPVDFYQQGTGMGTGDPLPLDVQEKALNIWNEAYICSLAYAEQLQALGVCKSQALRVINPTHNMRGVVTGTEDAWIKVLALRNHAAADPAMQTLARGIAHVIERLHHENGWIISERHTPYWTDDLADMGTDAYKVLIARIARVSYGQVRAREDDLALADRLLYNDPPHLSPAEHIAFASPAPILSAISSKEEDYYVKTLLIDGYSVGIGWDSYRALLEDDLEIPDNVN